MMDQVKPRETFGSVALAARSRKQLTQAEVAAAIGKSTSFVSRIENGRETAASPETVVRWADVLGIGRERLLRLGAPARRRFWAAAMATVDAEERRAS